MADELIMGIDAGTSRIRVLVFEMDGTVVAQGSSVQLLIAIMVMLMYMLLGKFGQQCLLFVSVV